MSEEIGLQRHVAFADPRLERSTAVKCTEADHYISTTARSDIRVLPVCLPLFKSPSWTALDISVVNQDPVPFTNQHHCLKLFARSLLADFSPLSFKCISISLPYCFPLQTSFFNYYVCACARERELCRGLFASRMCLDQFCSIGAVSFLLKCMGRSTKKRSEVRLHFNKEPSMSSLILCCCALQLQRNSALVTGNWSKRHWAFPELTSPHHNITVTHTPCTAVWCVRRVCSLGDWSYFHVEGIWSHIVIERIKYFY